MKTVYVIILIIVLCLILFNLFRYLEYKGKIASVIRAIMVVTAAGVSANIGSALSANYYVSQLCFTLFFVALDWDLLFMLRYIALYVGEDFDVKKSPWTFVMVPLAIADSVSLFLNVIWNHEFKIGKSIFDGATYLSIYKYGFSYYLHLAFCYLLVLMILFLLIRKVVRTQRFYIQKYVMILIAFAVVIAADGMSLLFRLPVNIGVIFYGILAIFVCYYSLSYFPSDLTNNTIKLAVENMDSGVICFDIEGKCAFTNPGLWRIFKMEPDASRAEDLFIQRVQQYDLMNLDTFRWNEDHDLPSGKIYIECEYHKMYDTGKKFVGSYFHISDITARIAEYEEQIRKAEADSKAKSDFVSKISHEIRTPINSVYGMNEMILREAKDPQILEYANDIKNSSEIMISIINDVLDYSKIESGKMELVIDAYDSRRMIANIYAMISERAKKKNLRFVMDIDPELPRALMGDVVRVEQIIINLLTNAVKYTQEGTVELKIQCQRDAGEVLLTVSVTDTGIGISEEDRDRLFIAYERLDEMKNHSIQGTGLGLNIVTQLLHLMDSHIEVESEYQKGSTFRFTIEQGIADEALLKAQKNSESIRLTNSDSAEKTLTGKSVLVVDDNAINRKVIKGLLKKTGLLVAEAGGGLDCLNMVQVDHYDLIFLDHMMPDLDGVETFKKMKELEDYPCKDVPVIMLTANAIDGAKEEYLTLGFDDFLSKPVIPAQLDEMIHKYLS